MPEVSACSKRSFVAVHAVSQLLSTRIPVVRKLADWLLFLSLPPHRVRIDALGLNGRIACNSRCMLDYILYQTLSVGTFSQSALHAVETSGHICPTVQLCCHARRGGSNSASRPRRVEVHAEHLRRSKQMKTSSLH